MNFYLINDYFVQGLIYNFPFILFQRMLYLELLKTRHPRLGIEALTLIDSNEKCSCNYDRKMDGKTKEKVGSSKRERNKRIEFPVSIFFGKRLWGFIYLIKYKSNLSKSFSVSRRRLFHIPTEKPIFIKTLSFENEVEEMKSFIN